MDDFVKRDQEMIRLNNEVAVPAYRKFCKENNLNFHFWDELSEEEYNFDIRYKELELHKEAMNCFNILKPRFILHENKIYEYYFDEWRWKISFNSWEVEEFLKQSDEFSIKISYLKKQLDWALSFIGIVAVIISVGLAVLFAYLFFGSVLASVGFVLGFLIPLFLFYIISKKYFSSPVNEDNKKIVEVNEKLEKLRLRFVD